MSKESQEFFRHMKNIIEAGRKVVRNRTQDCVTTLGDRLSELDNFLLKIAIDGCEREAKSKKEAPHAR